MPANDLKGHGSIYEKNKHLHIHAYINKIINIENIQEKAYYLIIIVKHQNH